VFSRTLSLLWPRGYTGPLQLALVTAIEVDIELLLYCGLDQKDEGVIHEKQILPFQNQSFHRVSRHTGQPSRNSIHSRFVEYFVNSYSRNASPLTRLA